MHLFFMRADPETSLKLFIPMLGFCLKNPYIKHSLYEPCHGDYGTFHPP